jgi:hypothetical protein
MSSPPRKAWRVLRTAPIAVQLLAAFILGLFVSGMAAASTLSDSSKQPVAATTVSSDSVSSTTTTTERRAPVPVPGQADTNHPSATLTPGAIFADATAEQVCVVGYSASVRDVSNSLRDQVFSEYGLDGVDRSQYEVDHLIALELGGSNELTNLWPQPRSGVDSATAKDTIENRLHDLVCNAQVSLTAAQSAIVHWDTVDISALSTTTTTTSTTTTTAPPTTLAPKVTVPPTTAPAGVYYANCTAAKQAGAAPIHRGEPGYRAALDRDGDGIACE